MIDLFLMFVGCWVAYQGADILRMASPIERSTFNKVMALFGTAAIAVGCFLIALAFNWVTV